MEDKTLLFIRIYSSGDKGRLCILGNIKEGPTSNIFILVQFWFPPPCPEARHLKKAVRSMRLQESSTPSLGLKVISSKIHGIDMLCTSPDKHHYLGVDKTRFSISLELPEVFLKAFLRISVILKSMVVTCMNCKLVIILLPQPAPGAS